MKSLFGRYSFYGGIAVPIALFLVLAGPPVMERAGAAAAEARDLALGAARERTGLEFRYESFSPSLFFSFKIRGLEVFDAATGTPVGSARRVSLSYSLWGLLRGKGAAALGTLSCRGAEIHGDSLIDYLGRGRAAPGDGGPKEAAFTLPFNVNARDITCVFSSPARVTAKIRSLSLRRDRGGYVKAAVSGRAEAAPGPGALGGLPESLRAEAEEAGGAFSLSGAITPSLAGSAARVTLTSVKTKTAGFKKLRLFAEVLEDKIRVSQLSGEFPADLACDISLPGKTVTLRMRAESFNPLQVFSTPPKALAKAGGLRLWGDYELAWGAETGVEYRAQGRASLPPVKTLGRVRCGFSIAGTAGRIDSVTLNAASETLDASFEGSFNLETLQPSGELRVSRYTVPNGNELSGDAFFDPLDEGFLCFVPELFLGSQTLTALQLTVIPNPESLDFTFELSDYSHSDYGEPGVIRLEGSVFLQKPGYAQVYASIENFFLDSALRPAAFFLSETVAERLSALAEFTAPYIMTNEIFVSTDFSAVTYNVPYSVIADTSRDRNFMVFSVDGNGDSVRLSRLDLALNGQSAQGSAVLDRAPDSRDFFFTADMVVNDIPYGFTGSVMPGVMASVSGDYGFGLTLHDNGRAGISGDASMSALPFAISKYVFALSTDMDFRWSRREGFEAALRLFEVAEVNNAIPVNPRLALSGDFNRYGFRIDTISYTDNVSELLGQGSISWSLKDSILQSAVLSVSVENPLGIEKCEVMVNLSNPGQKRLSPETLRKDFYLSAAVSVRGFPAERFLPNQSDNDMISAEFSALGTFSEPFITLNVENASLTVLAETLSLRGNASIEDKNFNLSALNARWGAHELRDGAADFSLETLTGEARVDYTLDFGQKTASAPLTLALTGDDSPAKAGGGPGGRAFTAVLSSPGFTGAAFTGQTPFAVKAVRRAGRIDVASVNTPSLSAWATDSGEIDARLGGMLPVKAHVHGSVSRNALDVRVDSLSADLAAFSAFLAFPVFTVYRGWVAGDIHIGGFLRDPDFSGSIRCTGLEASSPLYVPARFTSDSFEAVIAGTSAHVQRGIARQGKTGEAAFALHLDMDRWSFDTLRVNLTTAPQKTVAADTRISGLHIKGDMGCDMEMEIREDASVISGSVTGQNGSLEIMTAGVEEVQEAQAEQTGDVTVNLKISVGPRMQVLLNPLLRGLVAPGTELTILADTLAGILEIRGDADLRGGEIVYLGRNFYLKEGRIAFNETFGAFDPRITIRAETRDRDSEGEQVTIIMTASNQLLSRFSPVYTASPSKSETEIMQMLGQIIAGDSATIGDLTFTMLDYGVQLAVLRRIETGLRELLNFDIFSLRTMVLQNVLKKRFDSAQDDKPITAGSVLENSTLYAGKYFGSSIYADALMHLSYDENEVLSGRSATGIVFQPEIGLEMASPFVTIRWSVAPELGKTDFLWVDAASITLSWKFSF